MVEDIYKAGMPPKQVNGLAYTGLDLSSVPVVNVNRAPTVNDGQFPLFTFWRNSNRFAVAPDAEGDMWFYAKVDGTVDPVQHIWLKVASGTSGPLINFDVPLGTSPVLPDGSGSVTLTSAAGTLAITGGTNSINLDLVGGTVGLDSFAVPNGTSPVFPDGTGEVTYTSSDSSITITGSANSIDYIVNSSMFTSLSPYIVGDENADYSTIQAAYNAAVAATSSGDWISIYIKEKGSNGIYDEVLTMTADRKVLMVGFAPSTTTLSSGSFGQAPVQLTRQLNLNGEFVFSNISFFKSLNSLFVCTGTTFIRLVSCGVSLDGANLVSTGANANVQFRAWNSQIVDSVANNAALFIDAEIDPTTITMYFDFENSIVLTRNTSTCTKGRTRIDGLNSRVTASLDATSSLLDSFNMEHCIHTGDLTTGNATFVGGKNTIFDGQFDVASATSYIFNDCSFSDASNFITQQPQTIACGNVSGYKRTTEISANYVLTHLDNVVDCDTSTIALAIDLPPSPFLRQMHTIKDSTGDAATNNITVGGNGNTIDGVGSIQIIGAYQSLTFLYDGTEWKTIQSYEGVDTSGFVFTSNGPGNTPTFQAVPGVTGTQIGVDTNTAPGTDPVIANMSNVINITGGQVTSATVGANVIQTNSLAANSLTIEIQQTGTAASADTTLNGVAHFDSAFFTAATGFVSLDTSVITTRYDADSGSATPTAGVMQFVGGSNVTTSALGNTVTINATGTITPNYIDPVRVATNAALSGTYSNGASGVGATLTNNSTQAAIEIDGVTLSTSDRVLVKNQASQEENGVYEVTTVGDGSTNWVLTRTTDYDTAAEISPGDLIPVLEGDTFPGAIFVETLAVTTMGTDPLNFAIFQPVSALTPWQFETTTAQTLQAGDKYFGDNAAQVVFTLPTSATAGTEIEIAGVSGQGGWRISQNAGQSMTVRGLTTTTGASGYVESTDETDSVRLVCTIANTKWQSVGHTGFPDVI